MLSTWVGCYWWKCGAHLGLVPPRAPPRPRLAAGEQLDLRRVGWPPSLQTGAFKPKSLHGAASLIAASTAALAGIDVGVGIMLAVKVVLLANKWLNGHLRG